MRHLTALTAAGIFLLAAAFPAASAVQYAGAAARDPFLETDVTAQATAESAGSAFFLQGIIWNPQKARAIINGHVIGVGSNINGAEVLQINRDSVKMSANGKIFMLDRKGKKL